MKPNPIAVFLCLAISLFFASVELQAAETFSIPLKSGTLELEKGKFDTSGARYQVILFDKRLKRKDVESLRATGINPLSFLYKGAWLCSVEPGALTAEVQDRFEMAAATAWQPEHKMPRRLHQGDFRDWAIAGDGRIKLLVSFFEDVSRPEMEQVLGKYVSDYELVNAPTTWAIRIDQADIVHLLHEPAVRWVEEGPQPFEPLNDQSRAIIAVGPVQAADLTVTPPVYLGLSGRGVNIAVSETVDTDHPDFWDHDAAGNPTFSRFLNSGGKGFHGTHVAGIIGGNGWNSARDGNSFLPYQLRGMAPEAALISGHGYNSYRVHASNHSYVMNYGEYGTTSQDVDKDIRRGNGFDLRKPHIWAAANQGVSAQYDNEEGYYSIYAPAKNALCVGAVNANDGSLAAFSSLGPTFDGRIKPDVMAGGCKDTLPIDFISGDSFTVEIDYILIKDKSGQAVRRWEFNTDGDLEGWFATETYNITDPRVDDGNLVFEVQIGGYGFVENVDLAADDDHVIEMRYRIVNTYPDFSFKGLFYWKDAGSSDYVDGNITYPVNVDSQFHVVTASVGRFGLALGPADKFEPRGLNGWSGTIDRLRIDPLSGSYGIFSTFSGTTTYLDTCGTSMAAPAATGTVALMLQQFVEVGKFVGDSWEAVDLDVNPPIPSTIKAILIQTATDLIHTTDNNRDPDNPDTGMPVLYHEGPDFATGYGLIDAQAAVEFIADAAAERHVHEVYMLEDTHEYEFILPPSLPEVKITLAWDDVEGSTALNQTIPRLVNDLDIVVKAPDGEVHFPWTLDPLPIADCDGDGPGCGDLDPIEADDIQPAYKAADHRNNVEQVQVAFPMAGTWKVLIYGDGIQDVTDGRQAYSLVSSVPLTKTFSDTTEPIEPIIEYVNEVNGTYTVYFGYDNPNDYVVVVEAGADNRLSYGGSEILPNPITKFQPGRNYGVFSINFDSSELSWTLNGKTISTSNAEIRHLQIRPILDRVEDRCDGNFTAYFGYDNPHAFPVTKEIGTLNNFEYTGYGYFWDTPPTQFDPGEYHEVFSVDVEEGKLVWNLDKRSVTAERQMASNLCPAFTFYKAFAFGQDNFSRRVPNAPSNQYIKVVQGGKNFLYDPRRGYGYTAIAGLDDSPNNRGQLSGADEIYDQFIGVKNTDSGYGSITFRIDAPPGIYRFVAAGGDARYPDHVTTLTVTNSYEQKTLLEKQELPINRFYRIGFDDKLPPAGDGRGRQPNFLKPQESRFLQVYREYDYGDFDEDYRGEDSGSYIEIIQKADGPIGVNGGDLCLIEIWYRPAIESVTEGRFDKTLNDRWYPAARHTFKITPEGQWQEAARFYGFKDIDEIKTKYLQCDGSKRRYAVGWHVNDLIEYLMVLGGEYNGQLILRGKADRPGPVPLSVFIDGKLHQQVFWDAENNCSQDVVVDVSTIDYGEHAVAVRFDADQYSGPGKPDLDRNLYLEGLIAISDEPYQYKLIEPNNGETYFIGDAMPIRWVAGAATQAADILISFDGGSTFIRLNESGSITRNDPEWGHFVFTIPARLYDPNQGKDIVPASTQCLIRIEEHMDPSVGDQSDYDFTIANQYKIIEPNGWESYSIGQEMTIRWLAAENATAADITISFDGGDTFQRVNRDRSIIPSDSEWGNYKWNIPFQILDSYGNPVPTSSTQCRVRISEHMDPNLYDESDDDFTILMPVEILAVSTGKNYDLAVAEPGARAYIDRSYTVAAISSSLKGGVLVRTANNDKRVAVSEHVNLQLEAYVRIYACYDRRANGRRPDWLHDWTAEPELSVSTTDGAASPLTVYSNDFYPGAYWFGGNLHGGDTEARSHYLLIVVPDPD